MDPNSTCKSYRHQHYRYLQISTDIIRERQRQEYPCLQDAKSTAQKISMVMRQLEKVCTTASSDDSLDDSLDDCSPISPIFSVAARWFASELRASKSSGVMKALWKGLRSAQLLRLLSSTEFFSTFSNVSRS